MDHARAEGPIAPRPLPAHLGRDGRCRRRMDAVWVDSNKGNHRRDGYWKKFTATAAKADCDDRRVREARAEYYTLTGQGVRATLAGSQVGFDQSNTRYKRGYRSFECWPDAVDPRGAKGK